MTLKKSLQVLLVLWLSLALAGVAPVMAKAPAAKSPAAKPQPVDDGLDEVSAKSFVIMDKASGQVLLSRNPDMFRPPASTLKVFTAVAVAEKLKLDDKVCISDQAAAAPPSKIACKPGQLFTVEELLYALLLSSGNDAARALAEKVSGSEEAFGDYVTKKAREWGAYRTNAVNASGLPAEDQFSTAKDLAVVFRKAMDNPMLAKIMATKTHPIQGGRVLRNHNRFLFTTPLAVGGKTGWIRSAQHTYVGMFQNKDKAIIVSIMGSTKQWADLRALIEKGFELEGTPIAKLPAEEEKLRFAKLDAGPQPVSTARVKKKRRGKVVTASVTSTGKKKARKKTSRKRTSTTSRGS